jgi:hypothetical protein
MFLTSSYVITVRNILKLISVLRAANPDDILEVQLLNILASVTDAPCLKPYGQQRDNNLHQHIHGTAQGKDQMSIAVYEPQQFNTLLWPYRPKHVLEDF